MLRLLESWGNRLEIYVFKYNCESQLKDIQSVIDLFYSYVIVPTLSKKIPFSNKVAVEIQKYLSLNTRLRQFVDQHPQYSSEIKNPLYYRILIQRWDILELAYIISDHTPKSLPFDFQKIVAEHRKAVLKQLLIDWKHVVNSLTREQRHSALAKIYLYCEATNDPQILEVQNLMTGYLSEPVAVIDFFQNELAAFHPTPKKIMRDGWKLAKKMFYPNICDEKLLSEIETQYIGVFLGLPSMEQVPEPLRDFFKSIATATKSFVPLRFADCMICVRTILALPLDALSNNFTMLAMNISAFFIKKHLLETAKEFLGEDKSFIENLQLLSPYNPNLYLQLEARYRKDNVPIESLNTLIEIILFNNRRLQMCLLKEKNPIYAQWLVELNKEATLYQQKLISHSESKEVKQYCEAPPKPVLPIPVISKITPIEKPTNATYYTTDSPKIETKVAPCKSKPTTIPFIKKTLLEAQNLKKKTPHTSTVELKTEVQTTPGDMYRESKEKAERHTQQLAVKINTKPKHHPTGSQLPLSRKMKVEHKKAAILLTLETHRLDEKITLAPKAADYAKRIAEMGLAVIHGGSVRTALEKSLGLETKDSAMTEEDVDIAIYYHAKLRKSLPRKDFEIISNGKQIKTVLPKIFSPDCSVQIFKKFNIDNPNTIVDSAHLCDFTINSFLARLIDTTNEMRVYSPLGSSAVDDLRARRLKAAHRNHAEGLFSENPICILRAFRFCLEKHYVPADDLMPAIHKHATRLNDIAPQAVNKHLDKLLMHGNARLYGANLDFMKVFNILFPQFATIDTALINKIFVRLDKTAYGKPKPLSRLFSTLLYLKHAHLSGSAVINAMEKDFENNSYTRLALVRLSPATRALFFEQIIHEFKHLVPRLETTAHRASLRV